MARLAKIFGLLFLLVAFADAHAAAQRAFVVGIDHYPNLARAAQLQRAANDARSVSTTLLSLGFKVRSASNIGRADLNSKWQSFLNEIGEGDTVTIYFAGHGIEIDGLNFLVPSDIPAIKGNRQEQIKRESFSVSEMLLDLRARNPAVTVLILDACRDNPFGDPVGRTGQAHGGLAKIEPPEGTFIMYAAKAGETALDRLPGIDPDRVNSVFTRTLIPLLKTRNLSIQEMARTLRQKVRNLAATAKHAQNPAYYDGLFGTFCFAGCEALPNQLQTTITTGSIHPSVDRLQAAAKAWVDVDKSRNQVALQAFLAQYGDTAFAELARARLASLPPEPFKKSAKQNPASPLAVNIVGVTGAPGDGNATLRDAIRKEHEERGVPLAEASAKIAHTIEATVSLGKPSDGKQLIAIDWTVKDPRGRKLGTVTQRNDVPEGSLDGPWGRTAHQAASAAAFGIIRLLPPE